jgi:ATP-dependent DNA ligase
VSGNRERAAYHERLVRGAHPAIVLNKHYEATAKLFSSTPASWACEGIVSKRLGSPYGSGRSPHWLKIKNPRAPAARREAEEDWRR